MAIVLAIVALLLGGLLPTISGQMEQARRTETRAQLDEIRSSLLGFAVANGRLPCPDTDNDGNENMAAAATTNDTPLNGQSTKKFSCSTGNGTLPYNQLGSAPRDGFGSAFIYGITPVFGEKNEVWSGHDASGTLLATTYFTLSSVGTLVICSGTTDASTTPCPTPRLSDTAAAVVLSRGPDWAQTQSIEETENTDGDSDFISHETTPTFDDLVIWISPNTLFNRMVAAGKLP